MEEEGVKSALELAMERIAALPQLTAQEIAEQKERENAPVGKAIVVKYLSGTLSSEELPLELNRYQGERQQMIRRSLLMSLCRELRLGNTLQDVERALLGMATVAPQKRDACEEAARGFHTILDAFETAKQKVLGEFGEVAGRDLIQLGIRGSAVRPNLNENESWKRHLAAMRQAQEPKLEKIRKDLLEEVLRG
ncbi:MAG TPA: hypothetical protein VMG30_11470 [Acidobacteriota bacterium]|nr:hypothetical protein [Acidobacteriota bacterium]